MNPWQYRIALLTLCVCLFACGRSATEGVENDIHQRSAKEDRVLGEKALREVRKIWAIDGDDWVGKLDNGSLVLLVSPEVATKRAQGNSFYTGWIGEVRIKSSHWRSYPAGNFAHFTDYSQPFAAVYRAKHKAPNDWQIVQTEGLPVSTPTQEELVSLKSLK